MDRRGSCVFSSQIDEVPVALKLYQFFSAPIIGGRKVYKPSLITIVSGRGPFIVVVSLNLLMCSEAVFIVTEAFLLVELRPRTGNSASESGFQLQGIDSILCLLWWGMNSGVLEAG